MSATKGQEVSLFISVIYDSEAFQALEHKRLYRSDGVSNVLFNYSAVTTYYNGWFQAFCDHRCTT